LGARWTFACVFSIMDFIRHFAAFGWVVLLTVPAGAWLASLLIFYVLLRRKVCDIRMALRVCIENLSDRDVELARYSYCQSLALEDTSKARVYVQVGLEGGCELFVDWTLHRFLVEKYESDFSFLLFLAMTASFFPSEFLVFNFVLLRLSFVRLNNPSDELLLSELRRIFVIRQSFSSFDSGHDLESVKNCRSECTVALRDFWLALAHGGSPIASNMLTLAKKIESSTATMREIASRYPCHPSFMHELATFLVDVRGRFMEGLRLRAWAQRIEIGEDRSYDRSFVQFVHFLPLYLKRGLVDVDGHLFAGAGPRLGSSASDFGGDVPSVASGGSGQFSTDFEDHVEVFDRAFLPMPRLRIAMAEAVESVDNFEIKVLVGLSWAGPLVIVIATLVMARLCSSVMNADLGGVSSDLRAAWEVVSVTGRVLVLQPYARAQIEGGLPPMSAEDITEYLGRLVPELEALSLPYLQGLIGEGQRRAEVLGSTGQWVFAKSTIPVGVCGPHGHAREPPLSVTIQSYLVQAGMLLDPNATTLEPLRKCSAMAVADLMPQVMWMMRENVALAVGSAHEGGLLEVADPGLLTMVCFAPEIVVFVVVLFSMFRLVRVPDDREAFVGLLSTVDPGDCEQAAERVVKEYAICCDNAGSDDDVVAPATGILTAALVSLCGVCELAVLIVLVLGTSRTRTSAGDILVELATANCELVLACRAGSEALQLWIPNHVRDPAKLPLLMEWLRSVRGKRESRFKEAGPVDVEGGRAAMYECLGLERLLDFAVEMIQQVVVKPGRRPGDALLVIHALAFVLDARVRENVQAIDEDFQGVLQDSSVETWSCAGVVIVLAIFQALIQLSDAKAMLREEDVVRSLLLRIPPFAFAHNEAILARFLKLAGRDRTIDSFTTGPQVVFERDLHGFLVLSDDGTIERANAMAIDLFEVQPAAVIGRSVQLVLPERLESNGRLYVEMEQVRADPTAPSPELEVMGLRDDGTLVPLGVVVVRIGRDVGRVSGFGLILRSLSTIKETAASSALLKRANDALADSLFPPALLARLRGRVCSLDVNRASFCACRVVRLSEMALTTPAALFMTILQRVHESIDQAAALFPDQTRIQSISGDFLFASSLFLAGSSVVSPTADAFHLGLQIIGRMPPLGVSLDVEFRAQVAVHVCEPVTAGLFGLRRSFDVVGDGMSVLPQVLAVCPANTVLLTKAAYEAIPAGRADAGIVPAGIVVDGVGELFRAGAKSAESASPVSTAWSPPDRAEGGWTPPGLMALLDDGGVTFQDLL
jgi:PAS domain-containing protein